MFHYLISMVCTDHMAVVCNEIFHSATDLGKDPLVRGRQVVEIRHTLTEPRALTDPVRTSGHTMELRRRDACWKQANGINRFLKDSRFCHLISLF